MGCIQKILQMKQECADPFFKIYHDVVVEGGGSYGGYDYLIVLKKTFGGAHRCGYVAIHPTNSFYNKSLDDMEEKFEVHGGVTFWDKPNLIEDNCCKDKWLGFDAAHARDLDDRETATLCFDFPYFLPPYATLKHGKDRFGRKIRTYEYMEKECKKLIEQLNEKN